MNYLRRLNDLPYNEEYVVWKSRQPSLEDLRWPDIGVHIGLFFNCFCSVRNFLGKVCTNEYDWKVYLISQKFDLRVL